MYDPPPSDDEESDPLATSDDEPNADQQAQEDVFGASLDTILAESRGARRRAKRRSATRTRFKEVPPHLTGLMGAATMAYVSQDLDGAEKMLKEIIEQAPRAVPPYRLLGLICDDKGEKMLGLEYYMKAIELNRSDKDLWKRLAARWEEVGNAEKAVYCLSQALRGTRSGDAEALRGRALLYLKLGKPGRAADSFVRLSKLDPADSEVAQHISKAYRKVGHLERAVPHIEAMIRSCDAYGNTGRASDRGKYLLALPSLIEVMTELRISLGKYFEATNSLSRLQYISGSLNRSMTFVQNIMMAICQHRLGSADLASFYFNELMNSPETYSEHNWLLWEVADASREGGEYQRAVDAYSMLLDLDVPERRAEMYLHRAVCQKEIGNVAAARSDLERVLKLQPRHIEASLRLQEFLPPGEAELQFTKKKKKSIGTAAFVSQAAREREAAFRAIETANCLFENGRYDGYVESIYVPLQRALRLRAVGGEDDDFDAEPEGEVDPAGQDDSIRDSEPAGEGYTTVQCENDTIESRPTDQARKPASWKMRKMTRKEKRELQALGANIMRQLADEQFVEVAERVLVSFQKLGCPEKAHPLVRTFESLSHLRVKTNRDLRSKLRMLTLVGCVATGNVSSAHEHARLIMLEQPLDAAAALAFSTVEHLFALESDEQRMRCFRYLMRLVKKNPESVCLAMIAGNCSSRGGLNIRRYTVATYLRALRHGRHHPLISLCLAIQVTYVAMGRRNTNRNEMVAYALAFMDDYRRSRKRAAQKGKEGLFEMESDYNVGRVMHQYGLRHMAADMYNRVLTHKYEGMGEEDMAWGDLKRDAAYNMMQIYWKSKNTELAVATCMEYLVF